MAKAHIPKKAVENLWGRIVEGAKKWPSLIDESFLDNEQKKKMKDLILKKLDSLEIKQMPE